jgi:protocatechuate 3,4-dioxygenase beta subunit
MWQANAAGEYAHPEDTRGTASKEGFQGFGRVPTDTNGAFRFTTIKPGPVPGPNGRQQAPHIVVSVFMRGLLRRLVTRIYFPDGPANSEDFVLNLIEPEWRLRWLDRKTPLNGMWFCREEARRFFSISAFRARAELRWRARQSAGGEYVMWRD